MKPAELPETLVLPAPVAAAKLFVANAPVVADAAYAV